MPGPQVRHTLGANENVWYWIGQSEVMHLGPHSSTDPLSVDVAFKGLDGCYGGNT